MARHAGVEIEPDDWMTHGYDLPLLVNMQPAGKYLSERFHRAGGVPAVMWELLAGGPARRRRAHRHRPQPGRECRRPRGDRPRRHLPVRRAAAASAPASSSCSGNLFDFAIMKTSVISDAFRERYLSAAGPRGRVRGARDRVRRLGRLSPPDQRSRARRSTRIASWSSAAPGRSAGRARPRWSTCSRPTHLLRRGINNLPTIGDGRQSGTSDSPSILNASPESAAGGGLAWLRTGDTIRIDLNAGTCDALVDEAEIARRRQRGAAAGAREPHAVGGNLSREDRSARRRRGARHGRQISGRLGEDAAAQSLSR